MKILLPFLMSVACLSDVQAAVYEVGVGKPYSKIGAVPWANLQPGDTVLIHWRSTPYKEKWVICRQGTAAAPITVRGVPNSSGLLPVIDGNGAVTPSSLRYTNEERGVIKIGSASTPANTMPQYIVIENLDVKNARKEYTFRSDTGSTQNYLRNAAAIYIEKGEHITIRNNKLSYSGNGLFTSDNTKTLLIESNYFYGNGNVGSALEHNSYTSAIGITYQYNRFGPLRSGANGNNLKDRSAGLVVRYNWIEGGNRQLDLVESSDARLYTDPRYDETFVYGNTLIERAGDGNRQIVHYGGDNGNQAYYRKGRLYFYNNTVVSNRTDRTSIFRVSTDQETVDARNNIFYTTAAGSTLAVMEVDGRLEMHRNWLKPGWQNSHSTFSGIILNSGSSIESASPGFANEAGLNYKLVANSVCLNAAAVLSSRTIVANNVTMEYKKHKMGIPRVLTGLLSIGAYERN